MVRPGGRLISLNVTGAGAPSLDNREWADACFQEMLGMRKVPDLSISPEKVFFIVSKARQSDDSAVEMDMATDSDDDLPEDHSRSTDRSELSGFIMGLNVDEQIDLVALLWLGRGDGDLDNWRDLRNEATRAHNNRM